MKNILLAGGTGLIGNAITDLLLKEGYHVHLLTRKPNSKLPFTLWDPAKNYIESDTLPRVDAVINLAGTGIADERWTESRKKDIIQSRVDANKVLEDLINSKKITPSVYVSASAIGIYGNRPNEVLNEKSSPGKNGFLVESVKEWENAIAKIHSENLRKVTIRIGIVLSMKGGALPKMAGGSVLNAVPYFGNGQQFYSWIHIDDLCRVFLKTLTDNEMQGIYNGVAPEPVTNEELCRMILRVNGKLNITFGVPEFALRLALGEMADVILFGANIKPDALLAKGFSFNFPEVDLALKDIFASNK